VASGPSLAFSRCVRVSLPGACSLLCTTGARRSRSSAPRRIPASDTVHPGNPDRNFEGIAMTTVHSRRITRAEDMSATHPDQRSPACWRHTK
jgi:hypothetical protein